MMLRLFGLFTCVLLAFVFPSLAYDYNQTAISINIISTVVSCVVVIAIFSRYVTTEDVLRESK
jgi:hypothetical protein